MPKAIETVSDAEDEVLAYMGFPKGRWTQLCAANLLERLNREIKRRMKAVPTFPNRDSRVKLAGHVLNKPARRVDGGREALCRWHAWQCSKRGKAGPSCLRLSQENENPNPLGRRGPAPS
ncbi:MAG: transposase [Eubacteriaceae bacterium]|nr:transposase [Eubacteriaceae bacterium]